MNCGQASEVNSAGTSFSAFARIGEAAIFMGMSNSDNGSSGNVCCSSFTALIFLELPQDIKKTIPNKKFRYFMGYLFMQREYNILSLKLTAPCRT